MNAVATLRRLTAIGLMPGLAACGGGNDLVITADGRLYETGKNKGSLNQATPIAAWLAETGAQGSGEWRLFVWRGL